MTDRYFSTHLLKRREADDPGPVKLTRGPSTNEPHGPQTPAEFVARHAIESEWEIFFRIVSERLAKEPRGVWERCGRCGFTVQRAFRSGGELTKPGSACFRCNPSGYTDGGRMRDLTAKEIKAHLAATDKARADAIARDRAAALARRNDERRLAGLAPFRSFDEWEKHEAARRAKAVKK